MATVSAFRPVNPDLAPPESAADDEPQEAHTPTTPRPNARFAEYTARETAADATNPITPTRHDFGGIPGQRALPTTPFSPSQLSEVRTPSSLARGESHRSVHSHASNDSGDVEMADDDEEDEDDSDNDSVTSDTNRPRKKKKGQRFFCTDFPPCQLSFTRSEHLARHIRYDVSSLNYKALLRLGLESTPGNVHFNAIAHVDSPVSTTSGSTLRLSTRTKTFLEILWLPLEPASNAKSELTVFVHQTTDQEHRLQTVRAVTAEATAEICLHPA